MQFTVITLFPQMIETLAKEGLVGQAYARGDVGITTINPRQFTTDAHHTVDDRAFGGGDGMVMKVEPLRNAVKLAKEKHPAARVVVLSPQGRTWNQDLAQEFAERGEPLILVCGRYAGIDQRFSVLYADDEISIGDYILNGGELAASVIIESVARLRPQVLGNEASAANDSFVSGGLECPQYTRPREVEGLKVPSPLLSGHHENIARFQAAVSEVRTAYLRPDLMPKNFNVAEEVALLSKLEDDELKALGLSRGILNSLAKGIR